MKTIKQLEEAMALRETGASINEIGVHYTIFQAYEKQQRSGNTWLDFDSSIWLEDIETIVEQLREFDVDVITVSSSFSSLLDVLAGFEETGCEMLGLTKVMTVYDDKLNNAIKFAV